MGLKRNRCLISWTKLYLAIILWKLYYTIPLLLSSSIYPKNLELNMNTQGFPHSSVGKESACNAGDPGSILGSGRSPGEGIGYPLQYSWASLVAQLVKNLPVMRDTWVWSLGWEDPLEKGKATTLQYSGLENSTDCIVHGVTKSWTQMSNFHFSLSLWIHRISFNYYRYLMLSFWLPFLKSKDYSTVLYFYV